MAHSANENGHGLPEKSDNLAWVEFITEAGIHPMRLGELIEAGWIEPVVAREECFLFRRQDVYRTRKLVRLCRDLELGTLAGSIIVDLLQRIESLEQEVRQLRSLL